MRFVYDPVLAGDEDMCRHDGRTILVIPNVLFPECEGGSLLLKCERCDQTIEEGTLLE